jgi:hypothetical protein
LKTGTTAGLKMGETGINGCLNRRQEIIRENPSTVDRLETIPKGRDHDVNRLLMEEIYATKPLTHTLLYR